MHTNLMKDIVLSSQNKSGKAVKIKVLNGPLSGKEFQAKKVKETVDGVSINCYHIVDNSVKTYFLEKDVLVM